MKLLIAPRQPFVGLALIAAVGIIVAELVPLAPTALISVAIILGICIVLALCWPNLTATYLIVAAGFFLLHKFATTNTAGQQLVDKLTAAPGVRSVTYSTNGLFGGTESSDALLIPGFRESDARDRAANEDYVGPDYFGVVAQRIWFRWFDHD